jgi:hypothetical protein
VVGEVPELAGTCLATRGWARRACFCWRCAGGAPKCLPAPTRLVGATDLGAPAGWPQVGCGSLPVSCSPPGLVQKSRWGRCTGCGGWRAPPCCPLAAAHPAAAHTTWPPAGSLPAAQEAGASSDAAAAAHGQRGTCMQAAAGARSAAARRLVSDGGQAAFTPSGRIPGAARGAAEGLHVVLRLGRRGLPLRASGAATCGPAPAARPAPCPFRRPPGPPAPARPLAAP